MFLLLLALGGCGGGSSGTGTRDLEGRVAFTDGSSPAGTSVTIVENGATAIVGADGAFVLPAPEEGGVTLSFDRGNVSASTEVADPSTSPDAGQVIEVIIDPIANTADLHGLEVTVKIEGGCDVYFENTRIIRQANETPVGVRCPLRVRAKRNGRPVGGVPFSLEYKSCVENDDYDKIVSGVTETDGTIGFGEVMFKYFDDPAHCVYRVVTPTPFQEGVSIQHYIVTLTAQKNSEFLPDDANER